MASGAPPSASICLASASPSAGFWPATSAGARPLLPAAAFFRRGFRVVFALPPSAVAALFIAIWYPLRTSISCHRQLPEADGGRDHRAAEERVVPDGVDALQHLEQLAGHGHLLHREGQLAVLDPQPVRPARVVAGDDVGPAPQ